MTSIATALRFPLDGVADCLDNCPEDINKSEPEICGCGVPEDDSDSDGFPDCLGDQGIYRHRVLWHLLGDGGAIKWRPLAPGSTKAKHPSMMPPSTATHTPFPASLFKAA